MEDIVKRLKYQSGWTERTPYMGRTSEMLWDAIEEIERLRNLTDAQSRDQTTLADENELIRTTAPNRYGL